MDLPVDVANFNDMFVQRLRTPDGVKEAEDLQSRLIRQRVWEDGFARKLLPPKEITRDTPEVQEDLKTDTIYYLAHVETLAHATSVNLRGNGQAEVWYSRKFPIGLHKIETMHHTTDEYTIKAMSYPYSKLVERQFKPLIEMVEDRELLIHLEAACWTIQKWEDPTGFAAGLNVTNLLAGTVKEFSVVKSYEARSAVGDPDDFRIRFLSKNDAPLIARQFPGTQGESMVGEQLLITEYDYHGINTWVATEVGNDLAGDLTTDAFKKPTLAGFKWVKTNKTSILRPGNIFMLAAQQFLGFFLKFIDTQVVMERYGDKFETWAWEVIGMGLGNFKGVKKMELYTGSATPGAETTGAGIDVTTVRPLPELQILMENAIVDHTDSTTGSVDGYLPYMY
jgi:hypothetical protein